MNTSGPHRPVDGENVLHVYAGPTLDGVDLGRVDPEATVHSPIRHGDLFDPGIEPGDTVLILDGVYHHLPALRHKEILDALDRGVRVIGAASIGALRAAELKPFGMVGVGKVFDLYHTGAIEGDDEVAVAHAADGRLTAFNLPLVNIRFILQAATRATVCDNHAAADVLEDLRRIYYPQRTLNELVRIARQRGETQFADWLLRQFDKDPHFGDQKRADALLALDYARSAGPVVVPDTRPDRSRDWRTSTFRDWKNLFLIQRTHDQTVCNLDRLWYQQIFDKEYKTIWARYLEFNSCDRAGGASSMPIAQRYAEIFGTPTCRDTVSRLMPLTFRVQVDLSRVEVRDLVLCNETAADLDAIDRYLTLRRDFERRHRRIGVRWFNPDITLRLLAEVWQVEIDRVAEEARLRGFHTTSHARGAFRRFVIGYLTDARLLMDGKR
jgi:hypothetical protein